MEDKGFKVKAYKLVMEKLLHELRSPIIPWTKYQGDEPLFIPELEMGRVDKLKSLYSVTPDLREMDIDPDEYDYFKKFILGHE